MTGAIQRVFYKPEEVAKILKCSLRTVYRRIQDGTIPSLVLRGIRRVPVENFHKKFGGTPL
jgi:excisionase family DNA binding protein